MPPAADRRPLVAAGIALGVGLGGFADGIVLHQMLQVHGMLTARYPKSGVDAETALVNAQVNMVWDGVFHAFTWAATLAGVGLLWRAGGRPEVPRSAPTLVGSMLLGWGLFDLVEGVIDHHVLHLHHVTEGPGHLTYDLLFLAFGSTLVAGGVALIRTGGRRVTAAGAGR